MTRLLYKFIKIGKEEHILDLYNKGEIYFNTYEYFRDLESKYKNNTQGDFSEGLKYTPIKNLRFPCFDNITITKAYFKNFHELSNLCCFYMIDREFISNNLKIDSRVVEFGDIAIIIKPKEFIERIKNILPFEIAYNSVKYYNIPNIPSKITAFHKRDIYKHQNEFRISFSNSDNVPLKFSIGDISDISMLVLSKDLHKIKFNIK